MPVSPTITVRAVCLGLTLATVSARSGFAQEPVSSFPQLSTLLERGNVVLVFDDNGERAKGKITELSDKSLQIVTGGVSGRTLTLTADRVARVSKVDSRLNGLLIGAVFGIGSGLYSGFLVDTLFENEASNGDFAYPLFSALMGLAGGGIGYAIDGAIDGETLVFRRPSLTVSIKF